MFKSILVPLDGSPFAEHALPLAVAIARGSGATLRLMRVLQGTPQNDQQTVAQAYLEKAYQRVQAAVGVPVEYDLVPQETNVAESIRATSTPKRLTVVLTSHGRGAVSRLWLGSVADELVRSWQFPYCWSGPGE